MLQKELIENLQKEFAVTRINDSKTEGVAIVLACETDFVGKNESFVALGGQFADIALNYADKESFLAADFGGMNCC